MDSQVIAQLLETPGEVPQNDEQDQEGIMDETFFQYLRSLDTEDLFSSYDSNNNQVSDMSGRLPSVKEEVDLSSSMASTVSFNNAFESSAASSQLFSELDQYFDPRTVYRNFSEQYHNHYGKDVGCFPSLNLSPDNLNSSWSSVSSMGSAVDHVYSSRDQSSDVSHTVLPRKKAGRKRKTMREQKMFPCYFEGCSNVYLRSSHLKVHVRKHTGEKPFQCTYSDCAWSFRRSDELSRHKRCHSGVKPYTCGVCNKSFARSDHLSKHTKIHEKNRQSHNIGNSLFISDDPLADVMAVVGVTDERTMSECVNQSAIQHQNFYSCQQTY